MRDNQAVKRKYTSKRFYNDLLSPKKIGNRAAELAVNKLNPRKIKSYIKQNVPINKFGKPDDIFEICKIISENEFISGNYDIRWLEKFLNNND